MQELITHINKIIDLQEQDKVEIKKHFTPQSIPKNAFFIESGQYCNDIIFIKKGKLRLYYLDENGEEVTCYFTAENSFTSSYTSFLTQTPTKENIQAIEDCEIYSISRVALEKLSEVVPRVQILRRIITENLFIAMERRVSMLQSQTAQERYENIIRETPDLILNVPQQYLASFLGITPQHLSRIRKSV